MYFLRKAKDILDPYSCAVIQNGCAAHFPEYLMLVGYDYLVVQVGGAVKGRNKVHLEPSV